MWLSYYILPFRTPTLNEWICNFFEQHKIDDLLVSECHFIEKNLLQNTRMLRFLLPNQNYEEEKCKNNTFMWLTVKFKIVSNVYCFPSTIIKNKTIINKNKTMENNIINEGYYKTMEIKTAVKNNVDFYRSINIMASWMEENYWTWLIFALSKE